MVEPGRTRRADCRRTRPIASACCWQADASPASVADSHSPTQATGGEGMVAATSVLADS